MEPSRGRCVEMPDVTAGEWTWLDTHVERLADAVSSPQAQLEISGEALTDGLRFVFEVNALSPEHVSIHLVLAAGWQVDNPESQEDEHIRQFLREHVAEESLRRLNEMLRFIGQQFGTSVPVFEADDLQ